MDASFMVLETIQNRRASLLFIFSTPRLFSRSSHTLCSASHRSNHYHCVRLLMIGGFPASDLLKGVNAIAVTKCGPRFFSSVSISRIGPCRSPQPYEIRPPARLSLRNVDPDVRSTLSMSASYRNSKFESYINHVALSCEKG
jgi:hypothetical protein